MRNQMKVGEYDWTSKENKVMLKRREWDDAVHYAAQDGYSFFSAQIEMNSEGNTIVGYKDMDIIEIARLNAMRETPPTLLKLITYDNVDPSAGDNELFVIATKRKWTKLIDVLKINDKVIEKAIELGQTEFLSDETRDVFFL